MKGNGNEAAQPNESLVEIARLLLEFTVEHLQKSPKEETENDETSKAVQQMESRAKVRPPMYIHQIEQAE